MVVWERRKCRKVVFAEFERLNLTSPADVTDVRRRIRRQRQRSERCFQVDFPSAYGADEKLVLGIHNN